MADDFEIGDLIETFADFTDPNGAAIDPDAVFFRTKAPDTTVTSKQFGVDSEVVKLAVGKYQANIDALAAGSWHYRWFATGNGQASQSTGFTVRTPKTA